MEIEYQVRYLQEVVRKHIPTLAFGVKLQIKRAVEERLMVDPIGFGKPLRYTLKSYRRLRLGSYHLLYRIEMESNTIIMIAIKHRREICQAADLG